MKRGSKCRMIIKNLRDLVRVSFADGLGGKEETSSSVSHCESRCVFKGKLTKRFAATCLYFRRVR